MNETQLVKRQRNTLSACILFSIAVHIAAIFMIQKHSLWFYSPKDPLFATQEYVEDQRSSSNEILKEVFQHMQVASFESTIHPGLEAVSQELAFHTEMPFPAEKQPDLSLSLKETLDQTSHLIQEHKKSSLLTKNLIEEHLSEMQNVSLEPFLQNEKPQVIAKACFSLATEAEEEELSYQTETSPNEITEAERNLPFSYPWNPTDTKGSFIQNESIPVHPKNAFSFHVPIPNLPSLSQLNTISCGEDFDIELTFIENPDEEGYIFALTLIPRPDLDLEKIKQNFVFLIDRSNSIQHKRLNITKDAVYRSLSYLDRNDQFNIVTFDSKLEKMSPASQPYNRRSLESADDFLREIKLASFFSSQDLCKPLFTLLNDERDPNSITTAILLSNGESLPRKTRHSYLIHNIHDWSSRNQGKISLFCLSLGNDKSRVLLDILCSVNQGKMVASPTHRGIRRRLQKLVRSISYPIAKDVSFSAASHSADTQVSLFPQTRTVCNLYKEEPYVILGKINYLDDFVLFMQGKNNGKWLNIKKTISFLRAKKGGRSLRKEWAIQNAYHNYYQFLKTGDESFFTLAGEALKPLNIESPFE